MQLSKAKFPLYKIPKTSKVVAKPPYLLLTTETKEYVLDLQDKTDPFVERRFKLLTSDPGYPVYRLKERYTSIAQVLNSKARKFIDSDGTIIHVRREKHHPTKIQKVHSYDRTHDGKFLLFTLRASYVSSLLYNYVVTINIAGADVLVGGVDDPADARRAYKL